jgi:signal transduction histidine kinase
MVPGADPESGGDAPERVRELAHELNNHLTAIRLTTELCERKIDDTERVERGLREIRGLVDQARTCVDELLRLGRSGS